MCNENKKEVQIGKKTHESDRESENAFMKEAIFFHVTYNPTWTVQESHISANTPLNDMLQTCQLWMPFSISQTTFQKDNDKLHLEKIMIHWNWI